MLNGKGWPIGYIEWIDEIVGNVARNAEYLTVIAKNLCRLGVSVADAVAYLLCLEEISPDMDEDTAVMRIIGILEKYPTK